MANTEVENVLGFVDKRRLPADLANRTATDINYVDVAAMRSRLFTISATAYSQSNLDKMTKNDMVWALRQTDDTAGI